MFLNANIKRFCLINNEKEKRLKNMKLFDEKTKGKETVLKKRRKKRDSSKREGK